MGLLKQYFLNSSLHGLHFIANSRFHWTERVFWILCVLASWGASLALMLSAMEQYQSQKISFSVNTLYTDWKTNFPSIVLCERSNPKKINDGNKKIFQNILQHLPKLEYFVFYDGTMRYKEVCAPGGALRDKCLLGNYSDFMHKFRSTCSEVIGSCFYNSEEFPCCDEFLLVQTYHGSCFAFNSLLSRKYPTRDQLPFKITRNVNYGYGNLSIELFHTGFYVYGLSQDSVPTKDSSKQYTLIESSKIISPGSHYQAFLSVKETFTEENARLMSIENRGCRFYDENNLKHSNVYSTSACENECLIEAQMKLCNCSVHTLPHNDQVKDCNFDQLLCVMDSDELGLMSRSCACITSCFDVDIHNIGYTIRPLKQEMFRDERSVVRIDCIVQPPSIRYTRDVVKTPLDMLVSVGGTVGLFIGASLLTIVEIFYYFLSRPLGDKYLQTERKKKIMKIKQQLVQFLYGYHFEYLN